MSEHLQELLNDVWQLENDLHNARRRFLNECGWVYGTVNPGATLYWQKEFDGKLIAVNEATAMDMAEAELSRQI